MATTFTILGVIVFGMAVGWIAQLFFGGGMWNVDWGLALVAGVLGSFVGGFLHGLIFDQKLVIRPSGLIGSLIGALIVTGVWMWWRKGHPAKSHPVDTP